MNRRMKNILTVVLIMLLVAAGTFTTRYLQKQESKTELQTISQSQESQTTLTPDKKADEGTQKTESQKEENKKEESAKVETSKKETTKQETTKEETTKQETTKDETPKKENTKEETPKEETTKQETTKKETPKKETAKQETTKKETPKKETAKQETTKKETPNVDTKKEETKNEPPSKKENTLSGTLTIKCTTVLKNASKCDPAKLKYLPKDGYILKKTKVTFAKGETVFDVIRRVCKSKNIQIEYSWTPVYNSYYIEGVNQLYEFDCGYESGWVYLVDGITPNYGCSEYQLRGGEDIALAYTCEGQGADVESESK